jgi:F0F1-type ATP synthase membrane subunit b/b'
MSAEGDRYIRELLTRQARKIDQEIKTAETALGDLAEHVRNWEDQLSTAKAQRIFIGDALVNLGVSRDG